MAKDNEKKDLDQLINSMFRGHRLNTVSAEDYLEQVRKSQDEMQSGLDQAQENQKKAEDTPVSYTHLQRRLGGFDN